LFSELELIHNDARIKERIGSNKQLKRVYNQPVFKEGQDYKIEYNIDRYNTLKQLI
jgi:hypothetical protein